MELDLHAVQRGLRKAAGNTVNRMWILALETSGPIGSIALCRDAECVDERSLELAGRHGQTLIPEIRRLLTEHGLTPSECNTLAVSIGPGSFTGLRVGVVCAKTYAYATGGRVVAVDTLTAVCCNAPLELEGRPVDTVHVICDAQRTDVFAAEFHRTGTGWNCPLDTRILPATAWAESRLPGDIVTGPGLEKYQALVVGKCHMLPETSWTPRAHWVAHLGRQSLLAGLESNVWSLEPRYFRRSSAEDKWDARRSDLPGLTETA